MHGAHQIVSYKTVFFKRGSNLPVPPQSNPYQRPEAHPPRARSRAVIVSTGAAAPARHSHAYILILAPVAEGLTR